MALNQFPRRAFSGAATLQTFTGDGSITAFTLSQTQTQNECFVYVDDVAQVPNTDYVINGTTLTFTSAPVNGAEIIVRGFGVPTPLNSVSDGSVTAAKLATGAIESKLGYTPVSPTQLSTQVANLVNSAPATLDTLNELATALGNDANYAATITTALGTKANQSTTYTKTEVNNALTPTNVSDKANTSTGYFAIPSGTTAQRPANPTGNMIRKNTTTGYIEYYDVASSLWVGIGAFSATGGTYTTYTSNGTSYGVHTFTTSGVFTALGAPKAVDILVVGGGGGTGATQYHNGGAGAGGVVYGSQITLSPGAHTIIVGGGGAAGNTQGDSGDNGDVGGDSVFGTLVTAKGGGAGGRYSTTRGEDGGCGGGGAANGNSSSNNAGTSNQSSYSGFTSYGYAGGVGCVLYSGNSTWAAGGGGGAGGTGQAGDARGAGYGGNGGIGRQFDINGTLTYYAGGGGGSCELSGRGGNGGAGGGGNGSHDHNAQNGSANTGGGGGGKERAGTQTGGTTGGSGIVIIRYTL